MRTQFKKFVLLSVAMLVLVGTLSVSTASASFKPLEGAALGAPKGGAQAQTFFDVFAARR